jgi:hypothetical protein
MRWLLQLYPATWRRRYGEEFAAVLQGQRLSLGLVVDVFGGAVDAWLHPQLRGREHEITKGEQTMTNEMMKRCAAGGPKLSQRDQILAGITMAVGALILATAYVVLRKLYHARPAVEALSYMSMPGMFLLYTKVAYLRQHKVSTQVVTVGGGMALLYLIFWGACEVAVRL